MELNVVNVLNPVWLDAEHSALDCELVLEGSQEPIPFTATAGDVELHGRTLFSQIANGDYGAVAEYTPPVDPEPLIEDAPQT